MSTLRHEREWKKFRQRQDRDVRRLKGLDDPEPSVWWVAVIVGAAVLWEILKGF